VLQLFAPIMPYVTEAIWQSLFSSSGDSIHRSSWPTIDPELEDQRADRAGEELIKVATAVRRHKSDNNLSLGSEIERLLLVPGRSTSPDDIELLRRAVDDISSVTRAQQVEVGAAPDPSLNVLLDDERLLVALSR
jgi:valyl-tRNA synthetase